MFRRASLFLASLLLFSGVSYATVFGSVRGIIHDPSHRPISDADVLLKAANSDFTLNANTNADGDFQFDSVPIGDYTVTVSKSGFAARNKKSP